MNIAFIAHDKKKELMVQFCIAYCGLLSKHTLCATGTTGKLIAEATGLSITGYLSGPQGGVQQIAARVAYDEIDLVLLFRDPLKPSWGEPYVQIVARMREAIVDAAATVGPGRQAVLTSHQAPIWVSRLAAEGRPLPHLPGMRQCTLASVTTFAVDADGVVEFIRYAEPAKDLLPAR